MHYEWNHNIAFTVALRSTWGNMKRGWLSKTTWRQKGMGKEEIWGSWFFLNLMLNTKTFTFCCRKGDSAFKGRKSAQSQKPQYLETYAWVKNLLRKLKIFQYVTFKVKKKIKSECKSNFFLLWIWHIFYYGITFFSCTVISTQHKRPQIEFERMQVDLEH